MSPMESVTVIRSASMAHDTKLSTKGFWTHLYMRQRSSWRDESAPRLHHRMPPLQQVVAPRRAESSQAPSNPA